MMENLKRRDFLKLAGGITISSFAVPDSLLANDGSGMNDFKAMVVVDMQGGNDALNMFIPADDRSGIQTGYESYAKARSSAVRIEANDLMGDLRKKVDSNGHLALAKGSGNIYYDNNNIRESYTKGFYRLDKNGFDSKVAINPVMPELAYWMDRGKGAIIQNVGSISAPATKSDLKNKIVKVPPFIFAHNQQARLMRTGQASSINVPTGWLGRTADKWDGLGYGSDVYKMNISLSKYGRYKMFFGNKTSPMAYNSSGPTNYANGFDAQLHKDLATAGNTDMLSAVYNKIDKNMINQVDKTINDWKAVSGSNEIFANLKDSYGINFYDNNGRVTNPSKEDCGFNENVSSSTTGFISAAKLLKIGKDKGFKRMVISITLGGYDQHSTQSKTHSQRIRGFSLGLDRFMRTMEELGLMNNVTLFTVSEFARSTGSNNDGTDHAWGGAQMVLGGAVKPGNYGRFPDLTLGGDEDYSSKGRLIPSTSFSQYYGTLLKWFGADEEVLNHALPELKNFSTKDLGFMN
jgi:uncharacterized protein (DUF1501 family)